MLGNNEKLPTDEELIPVPAELPPLAGMDEQEEQERAGPGAWLMTLIPGLGVAVIVLFVIVLGAKGIYDGLKDRTLANHQLAQERYASGLAHLESGDYERAIAELEFAMEHNPNLPDLHSRLQQAKEQAQTLITPTSETRREAAEALFREATMYYDAGEMGQAVSSLDELQGVDSSFERESVESMLGTAHYQLGLDAVAEDQLDDASAHFERVMDLGSDPAAVESAQEQLNLLNLYNAALRHWETDWSATIQALKGLLALAPEYKDVRLRLHDAYFNQGQQYADNGDWCQALEEYVAAMEVFPLEATADQRDDASLQCQEETGTSPAVTATKPTATPRPRGTARATALATTPANANPTTSPPTQGKGQIVFPSYDAVRRQSDLYVVNLATGTSSALRENASQPAFSADGRRLAFRNLDPLHLGVGVLDLGSGDLRDLTVHAEDSTPAWSPDALHITFASDKHGDRKWRIYAISPGEVRGEGEMWVFGQMPSWSPAGTQVAYHGCDPQGNECGVWVMGANGQAPSRLTTDPSDTAPSWSPDGSQVVYTSARSGNWELHLVDVTAGEVRPLTDHPAMDLAPTWSPDGKQVAFLSDRGGSWAVHILDVKTGAVQKVIATGDGYPDAVGERLSWGP